MGTTYPVVSKCNASSLVLPIMADCKPDADLCSGMMTHVHSVESHMVKMQRAVSAMGNPATSKELDAIQHLFKEFDNRTKLLSADSLQEWTRAGVNTDLGAAQGADTEHLTPAMRARWQQLSGQLEVTCDTAG